MVMKIGENHKGIEPKVVRNIHLNEKCTSNVKKMSMFHFDYEIFFGRYRGT